MVVSQKAVEVKLTLKVLSKRGRGKWSLVLQHNKVRYRVFVCLLPCLPSLAALNHIPSLLDAWAQCWLVKEVVVAIPSTSR